MMPTLPSAPAPTTKSEVFPHLSGPFGPFRNNTQINQQLFNLDNRLCIRYIRFKTNKITAGSLTGIRLFIMLLAGVWSGKNNPGRAVSS